MALKGIYHAPNSFHTKNTVWRFMDKKYFQVEQAWIITYKVGHFFVISLIQI